MGLIDLARRWFGSSSRSETGHQYAVTSSWLQLPTLAPGGRHEIVGESHYQSALEAVSGGRDSEGTLVKRVTVVLERDRRNRYDRDAVRVVAGGQTVGHVPRDRTRVFHPAIDALSAEGRASTARARLLGGWDRGPDDRGTIGLDLDLALPPRPSTTADPFLPMEARVALVGEEHCQAVLATVGSLFTVTLYRADQNPLRPRTPGPFVIARAEAGVVGCLSSTMTPRYLSLLDEVTAAGLPATAQGFRLDGAKGYQVAVGLPGTA
jgi:hypothetical protein